MRKETAKLIGLDRASRIAGSIRALLGWDQETCMPAKGVDWRSEQLAFIEGIAHERLTDPEIGTLLTALGSTTGNPGGDAGLEPVERAYLRVLRVAYDRETKLPADLVAELAREVGRSQAAWADARSRDDFAAFRPFLERMLELQKRKAACLAPGKKAYDTLLDLYEPGADEAGVGAVFGALRTDLVSILDRIRGRPQVDDSCLHRRCAPERQRAVSDWLMKTLDYDLARGRLDTTAHPFTETIGRDDVRITTRFLEDFLPTSVFGTMHEVGHALYEQGIAVPPEYAGTRLDDAASTGIHESQSRLWENVVGRSEGFWSRHYPTLASLAGNLEGVAAGEFVRAVNKVGSSLIRIEADEVTYGLHIILRFELESAMLSGSLSVKDLPGAWREKVKSLLGIDCPNDSRGCLQDIHWSMGYFGYFPGYALGNLYAAQLWDAMRRELPGVEAGVARGELAPILGWLRKKVHADGAIYLPSEIVQRATGAALDPRHFSAYLEAKYSRVYGF